jgi:hypothetical protein
MQYENSTCSPYPHVVVGKSEKGKKPVQPHHPAYRYAVFGLDKQALEVNLV